MILLISDTHGEREKLQKIVSRERYDVLVFCGDGLRDLAFVRVPQRVIQYAVLGNCDRGEGLQADSFDIVSCNGQNILVVHGDLHDAKQTYSHIAASARANNVAAVFFGHTHNQGVFDCGGIRLINPGAVKDGRYALCDVGPDEINVTLKKI